MRTFACSIDVVSSVRKPPESNVIFSKRVWSRGALHLRVSLVCTAAESPPLKIGSPLDSLKTTELHDSFNEIHHGHRHEAIDIMRPRGTPVRAVTDGIIRKVFISRGGGLTVYEFDREGLLLLLLRAPGSLHGRASRRVGGRARRSDRIRRHYRRCGAGRAPAAFRDLQARSRQELVERRGYRSVSNPDASR